MSRSEGGDDGREIEIGDIAREDEGLEARLGDKTGEADGELVTERKVGEGGGTVAGRVHLTFSDSLSLSSSLSASRMCFLSHLALFCFNIFPPFPERLAALAMLAAERTSRGLSW